MVGALQEAMVADLTDALVAKAKSIDETPEMPGVPGAAFFEQETGLPSSYLTDLSDIEAVQAATKGRLSAELSKRIKDALDLENENFSIAIRALFPDDVTPDTIQTIRNALGGRDTLAWHFLQRQLLKHLWEGGDVSLRGTQGRSTETAADVLTSKTVKNSFEPTNYTEAQLVEFLGAPYFGNLAKMNENIEAFRAAAMQGKISRGAMRKIADGVPLGTVSERLAQYYQMATGSVADMSKSDAVVNGAMKGLHYAAKRWGVEGLYNKYADMVDDLPTGRGKFAWLLDQLMRQAHKQGTLTALVVGREAIQVDKDMDNATEEIPKAVPAAE